MLCENCGNKEANVKYTQIINGVKREMTLCGECAKKLGIEDQFNFDMPMDFPSLLGEFLEGYTSTNAIKNLGTVKPLKCSSCGMTYEEFTNLGKVGCGNCYETFGEKLDPILKNIQGSNRHMGRKGKAVKIKAKIEEKAQQKEASLNNKTEDEKIKELKQQLKNAIKEEKYEEAAIIRDEIKKLEEK